VPAYHSCLLLCVCVCCLLGWQATSGNTDSKDTRRSGSQRCVHFQSETRWTCSTSWSSRWRYVCAVFCLFVLCVCFFFVFSFASVLTHTKTTTQSSLRLKSIKSQPVRSQADYLKVIATTRPGDVVAFDLVRHGKRYQNTFFLLFCFLALCYLGSCCLCFCFVCDFLFTFSPFSFT